MHLIVCIKPILDPEIPPSRFRIDPRTQRPAAEGIPLVPDSYAENALETAIQLKERTPGARVTALCLGDESAEETLRRALSMTADHAVRVWDPAWAGLDGPAVAHVLARAVEALGGADLVLTGRQAGDVEEGLVGPVIAEELGWPCLTLASHVELAGGRVRVRREGDDGGEVVLEAPLPAVVTVTSSEANVPRLPKVRDRMLARGKPIRVLGAGDLRTEPGRLAPGAELVRMVVPEVDARCELIEGASGEEQASALRRRLEALKLL